MIGASLSACGSSSPSGPPSGSGACKTYITDGTGSPIPGYVTLTGQFYADETLTVAYTDNEGQLRTILAPVATDRQTVTLTGIETGDHTLVFQVSCTNDGKDVVDTSNPSKTVVVN
jgi:hypothetical protein